uniref:Heat-inducible transcription repressor HrcA n=1 Tax=Anthurium amnicola TaxID=1678845 RepID=A0A1D1XF45_9ARAE
MMYMNMLHKENHEYSRQRVNFECTGNPLVQRDFECMGNPLVQSNENPECMGNPLVQVGHESPLCTRARSNHSCLNVRITKSKSKSNMKCFLMQMNVYMK